MERRDINYRDNSPLSEARSNHRRFRKPNFTASRLNWSTSNSPNKSRFTNQRRIFTWSFFNRGKKLIFTNFGGRRYCQSWHWRWRVAGVWQSRECLWVLLSLWRHICARMNVLRTVGSGPTLGVRRWVSAGVATRTEKRRSGFSWWVAAAGLNEKGEGLPLTWKRGKKREFWVLGFLFTLFPFLFFKKKKVYFFFFREVLFRKNWVWSR